MFLAPLRAAPPNVLLIISDDHCWTDYGFMGHPQIKTPGLDRLARESLTFPRGYVPSSLCCPSLATILTGKYPHQHRITGNDPPLPPGVKGAARNRSEAFISGREQMNKWMDAEASLPRQLGAAGYRSLQTGKWWQGNFSRGGFTEGMSSGDPAKGGRHGDEGLKIGRQTMQPIYDFIGKSRAAGAPWFVWYAPMMPHDPHTPPERLLAKYRDKTPSLHVARYMAMVEWFDESVVALLDHLDREKLAEDTLVVYVTDNGWITDPETGRYAPKSKQSPYDGGLRTPIMLRWPGKLKPERNETPVSSVDLAPTILKACGLTPPAGLPGIDLADPAAAKARDAVFGECYGHELASLEHPDRGLKWRWVIKDGWKLIMPDPATLLDEKPELYHLTEDAMEERSRAAEDPDRVAALTKLLDGWWPGPQR